MASHEYIEAIGRRKTAAARVRLLKGAMGTFVVGDQTFDEYFKTAEQRRVARDVFVLHEPAKEHYGVSAHVKGGGLSSQAEAVRHGIARALIEVEPELRKKLKKAGFLKRDPRAKERRKFGLKKARKAPQWSKR
ncbi:MAG: 30S ribosomal protein S9 [bacterium]|nr:30S ribosomal protein S9 [bacterium]